MKFLLVLAGLGQLALALASLAVPRVLGWKEETAKLRTLTRQVFWTYSAFIWSTNVAFGLLSSLAPDRLLDRTPLARAVAGFVAAYWGARLLLQLFVYDRTSAPSGALVRAADAAMTALFLGLTLVYGALALGRG
jgi:hypothetical protein